MGRLQTGYAVGAAKRATRPVLTEFLNGLTRRQFKAPSRNIRDFVVGILAGQRMSVSTVARTRGHSKNLVVDENRYCAALRSSQLDDDFLHADYMRVLEPHLKQTRDLVIAIDETDVQKPFARRKVDKNDQRYMYRAWDGVENKQGWGWSALAASAVTLDGKSFPLGFELYSPKHPEFNSAHDELRKLLRQMKPYLPENSICVADRGFDSTRNFKLFDRLGMQFAIRVRLGQKSRGVWLDGKGWTTTDDLVSSVYKWERWSPRRWWKYRTTIAYVPQIRIRLETPGGSPSRTPSKATYSLVILKSRGFKKPLVILTNRRVNSSKRAREVARAYSERWSLEEDFRYLKDKDSGPRIEKNLMVRNWTALTRLLKLMMFSFGFMALLAASKPELAERLCNLKLHYKPTPRFLHYRLHATLPLVLAVWTP